MLPVLPAPQCRIGRKFPGQDNAPAIVYGARKRKEPMRMFEVRRLEAIHEQMQRAAEERIGKSLHMENEVAHNLAVTEAATQRAVLTATAARQEAERARFLAAFVRMLFE